MTDTTETEGLAGTPPAGEQEGGEDATKENIVHLSPDMLPGGASVKSGDRLTFVVTGDADEEGDVPGYFEGADSAKEEDSEEAWANEMRQSMSPRQPVNGAQ